MNLRFKEAMPPHLLRFMPDNIDIGKSKYIEAKLIRLLLGTLDIEFQDEDMEIQQRTNYSRSPRFTNVTVKGQVIKDFLSPLKIGDLDSYLKNTKNANYAIIQDLLYEYSYYFYNEKRGCNTSAFIHLYRILEFSSFCFPLIHASSSKKFMGTFNSLREYFSKSGGELEFLNKFVSKMFEDDPILETDVVFSVLDPNPDIKLKIYNSYKNLFQFDFVVFEDHLFQFKTKNQYVIQLIVHLRNRYFHFAIGGQKNISSCDVTVPDKFFKHVNDKMINWLSIVNLEVLKVMISTWK